MNTYEQSPPQKKSELSFVMSDNTVTHDVSEEFTLPDYVPEVRKILFTRAQILPESQYISDAQSGACVDFGGSVTYSVIYTDDEGRLCSTPLSSSYEASCPLKATPGSVFIDTVPDNVTTRASAPRRLSIKARLKSRIFATEEKVIEEKIGQRSSADELFIERLTQDVKTMCLTSASLSSVKMSEKFDIGEKKEIRPILCDAFSYVKDVSVSSDCISVKAEAVVKCIYESEGEIFCATKNMPIYEQVEAEGVCSSDIAHALVRCVSLSISSEESEGDCQLFFDLSCEIGCEAYRNESNTLTKDIYSTKHEMNTEYKSIDTYSVSHVSSEPFAFNEAIKRKSKDAREIVCVIGDALYEKSEFNGRRAGIFGRLCINVISSSANENSEREYSYESYEFPFKYETSLDSECVNPLVRASFCSSEISAKYTDDKLHISTEIFPCVSIIDKKPVQILDNAELLRDKEIVCDSSLVKVYFPKSDDTLWQVAKKYHVTRKQLIDQNMLSDDKIGDCSCLIV